MNTCRNARQAGTLSFGHCAPPLFSLALPQSNHPQKTLYWIYQRFLIIALGTLVSIYNNMCSRRSSTKCENILKLSELTSINLEDVGFQPLHNLNHSLPVQNESACFSARLLNPFRTLCLLQWLLHTTRLLLVLWRHSQDIGNDMQTQRNLALNINQAPGSTHIRAHMHNT